eukprot:3398277-Pleurochrysis_carterae.AAC.1
MRAQGSRCVACKQTLRMRQQCARESRVRVQQLALPASRGECEARCALRDVSAGCAVCGMQTNTAHAKAEC